MQWWQQLVSADFMPHGFCYMWNPHVLWLNVISDALIAFSYYCIPLILVYFIRKHRDLPFNRIFWMFGTFILACGTTHIMEVWNIWHANYISAGLIKAVTAVVSVITTAMLIPLVPQVISLPERAHLQEVNRKLQEEIAENKRQESIETPLRRRITFGFIAAILLIILMVLSYWQSSRQASEDADWVAHTYAVMDAIERVSKHIIEMETSARAFSLSGENILLPHYEAARKAAIGDVEELRHLVLDNPIQEQRVGELERQLRSLQQFASTGITRRRDRRTIPQPEEIHESEHLMEAVRAITLTMRAHELQLLETRQQKTAAAQRLTRIIIVLGIFIGAGLLALAQVAVNRSIGASERTRAQINQLNAELEQRVEQRTASLKESLTDREKGLKEIADQKFALDQHAIVAFTDVQGTITYVNDKFCAISKYSRDELLGQNHRILNSGYHPKEFFKEMYHTIANGKVWHGEIKNHAKDGTFYWVDTTIVPTLNAAGKPERYVAIRADITERKLGEEALREAGQLLLETQRLAHIGSWAFNLTDADRRLTYSDEMYQITSLSPDTPLSLESTLVAVHPEDRQTVQHWLDANILGTDQTGSNQLGSNQGELDVRLMRPDGSVRYVSMRCQVHYDAAHRPIRVSGSTQDITERKLAEEQIKQLNDDLEIRVIERTAQLEAVNKELEAFSYSVSHDLRAPLRHIAGFSAMLVEEYGATLDTGAKHLIERVQAGTQKMGLLVDELLNLARVGRHAVNRRPTDLNTIVAEVIAMLAPETEGRAVEWKIAELPQAECDGVLVRQVFQNFLTNALKFTRSRTPAVIEVATREDEDEGQTVFMIRDNGIGFNMKYVGKLFGVFQRLHSTDQFEGTGIGLATVQRVVQKHGGRVWAEGEVDKGATFYFTLGAGKHAALKANGTSAGGQL
jgi:PAS domain S-box-containing protein